MNKFIGLSLTALMTASLWQSAMAQPPGGFGGGQGREMRGGPRMGDRDKMQLNRVWRGIGELESSSAPLSKAQARRIVALVRPWSSKPQMTSAQAKTLTTSLSSVLTSTQKSQLQKMRGGRENGDRERGGQRGSDRRGRDGRERDGRGRDGGGREGDGRRGPNGRGDGPPPGFDATKMRAQMQKMQALQKTINPFYPPSKYSSVKSMPERMREGMNRRYERMRSTLTALTRKAA